MKTLIIAALLAASVHAARGFQPSERARLKGSPSTSVHGSPSNGVQGSPSNGVQGSPSNGVQGSPAKQVKVDLSKETVGKPPATFEPMVGTWLVAQDGADTVIMIDGRPWVASKDNPTKLLIESARKLYGTNNEELMDNAKQFAYYPVAVLKSVSNFSNGSISMKFKTVGGDADRCSGILFNVKPNGDYLTVRYNGTEDNVVLWTFNKGVRKFVNRAPTLTPLELGTWHTLKISVHGTSLKSWLDDKPMHDYTLSEPVSGKVGVWSKTDSMTEFDDFVVTRMAK
jgi:hypothetical protein